MFRRNPRFHGLLRAPYSLLPTPYSLLLASCILLIASCTPASGPAPRILDVQPSALEVPRYDRFELVVALEVTYDNPYDVRDVELSVVSTGPDGREWPVPGLWDADDGRVADWRVRFAPSAEGPWRYRLQVQDRSGESKPYEGQFTCLPSESHGWLQVGSWVEPATSSRYLVYHDGTPFYGVGHCNAFDLMSYGLDPVGTGPLIAGWTQELWQAQAKPNLIGEFGTNDQRLQPALLHNGIWAGLAAGGAATPMEWNDPGAWGRMSDDDGAQPT